MEIIKVSLHRAAVKLKGKNKQTKNLTNYSSWYLTLSNAEKNAGYYY